MWRRYTMFRIHFLMLMPDINICLVLSLVLTGQFGQTAHETLNCCGFGQPGRVNRHICATCINEAIHQAESLK